MKLNAFDGGLSQRVDPSLILPNEGVEYCNIDNTSLMLKSTKDTKDQNQIVGGYFYKFKDQWFSSTAERDYIEYGDFLYYTEVNKKPLKNDGNRETCLGIEAPVDKVTTVQADPTASEKISDSASTLQYSYTYYNSQDGVESAPSPISDELSLAADKVVDVSGIVASTDVQVDKIRIYRIGDGITTMTLIEEIDNTSAVYRDDTLTLDLEGTLLDTYNNQPPLTGLRFLTEAYGIMFAAKGDKLYYSQLGEPDYWPATNFIDFYRDITGILAVPNGILVQQKTRTDILVGSTSAEFRLLPVSKEQGNLSHKSNQLVKNTPVWVSNDGICNYNGSTVQVMSKDKLGKVSLDVVNSAVHDENYYLCLTDGTLLVMDARFGLVFKEYKFTQNIDNILVEDDILYGRQGDNLVTLFEGDDINLKYLSPVLTEGEHAQTKGYNHVYIRSNGEFDIKILIDGETVHTKTIKGNKIHDISPPAQRQRGSGIQFDIEGTGVIYEIEYKVLGRQNGR